MGEKFEEITKTRIADGRPLIDPIVDRVFENICKRPHLAAYFINKKTGQLQDLDYLKSHWKRFLIAVWGGKAFDIPDFKTHLYHHHQHLGITSAHFDETVDCVVAAFKDFAVPSDQVNKVAEVVGAVRNSVIFRERPTHAGE